MATKRKNIKRGATAEKPKRKSTSVSSGRVIPPVTVSLDPPVEVLPEDQPVEVLPEDQPVEVLPEDLPAPSDEKSPESVKRYAYVTLLEANTWSSGGVRFVRNKPVLMSVEAAEPYRNNGRFLVELR